MSASATTGNARTVLDELLESDNLIQIVEEVPESVAYSMVRSRREEMFETFWEDLVLTQEDVLEIVRTAEDTFINEYEDVSDAIPEWMLRLEAQDTVKQHFIQRFHEHTQE